jgi:hypothetical protein
VAKLSEKRQFGTFQCTFFEKFFIQFHGETWLFITWERCRNTQTPPNKVGVGFHPSGGNFPPVAQKASRKTTLLAWKRRQQKRRFYSVFALFGLFKAPFLFSLMPKSVKS